MAKPIFLKARPVTGASEGSVGNLVEQRDVVSVSLTDNSEGVGEEVG